jgi:hypothetical protein
MLPNGDDTTEMFLKSVERSSKFHEYKQKWRSRQRKVNTAADLIQCYYDDFRVISLSLHDDMPSTASRVSNQIKRLYHEISTLSESIHSRRNAHDLNMDVATFTSYFERSIEILARDHTSSLDFHPLSEDDSPLPTKFSEHMALVLGKMAKLGSSRAPGTGRGKLQLIKDMVPFLACSILCQRARNQHQGKDIISKNRPLFPANRFSRDIKKKQSCKSCSLTSRAVAWSASERSFGDVRLSRTDRAARTTGRATTRGTSSNALQTMIKSQEK